MRRRRASGFALPGYYLAGTSDRRRGCNRCSPSVVSERCQRSWLAGWTLQGAAQSYKLRLEESHGRGCGFDPVVAAILLDGLRSYDQSTASGSLAAANSVLLPKPKPRAMRVHFVVPSIHSREVTRAHRSGVRDGEDALQPLDFGNGLFSVHPSHYLTERREGQSKLHVERP